MRDQWILTGKVVSGERKAAYFTQLDWVKRQCRDKLGFSPYPGTLNLEIREESFSIIEELQNEKGIELFPPDQEFCVGKTLPVEIAGIYGALIIPSEGVRVHEKNIIEVMAGFRLKKVLNLKDGDSVTLVVHPAS